MYKYCVYTTIFMITGEIYQHLVIYKSCRKIDEDLIRYDTVNRYHKELLICDSYSINIIRKFK